MVSDDLLCCCLWFPVSSQVSFLQKRHIWYWSDERELIHNLDLSTLLIYPIYVPAANSKAFYRLLWFPPLLFICSAQSQPLKHLLVLLLLYLIELIHRGLLLYWLIFLLEGHQLLLKRGSLVAIARFPVPVQCIVPEPNPFTKFAHHWFGLFHLATSELSRHFSQICFDRSFLLPTYWVPQLVLPHAFRTHSVLLCLCHNHLCLH